MTPIAVYGATGHTGRLVAAELLARNRDVILAGRDEERLQALAREIDHKQVFAAPVEDPAALRELAEQAGVLVHCAGPFSQTGKPVAVAALEAGCDYIDHSLEQHHVQWLFDTLQVPAIGADVTIIPAMSFYGGFGDLLAGAVAGGLSGIEKVVVAYAVTGWRMTPGAKATATEIFAETRRITYADGAHHVGYVEPRNAVFPFPPPLGPRTVIAPLPSSDVVTIPRHVHARAVEAQLTADTFTEAQVFVSEHVSPAERAQTQFTVAVQAITPDGGRAGQVYGRDLWKAGALASVEAAVSLADDGGEGGVLSPAEAFAGEPFLRSLERLGALTLHL